MNYKNINIIFTRSSYTSSPTSLKQPNPECKDKSQLKIST